jgi:hypothetical protein
MVRVGGGGVGSVAVTVVGGPVAVAAGIVGVMAWVCKMSGIIISTVKVVGLGLSLSLALVDGVSVGGRGESLLVHLGEGISLLVVLGHSIDLLVVLGHSIDLLVVLGHSIDLLVVLGHSIDLLLMGNTIYLLVMLGSGIGYNLLGLNRGCLVLDIDGLGNMNLRSSIHGLMLAIDEGVGLEGCVGLGVVMDGLGKLDTVGVLGDDGAIVIGGVSGCQVRSQISIEAGFGIGQDKESGKNL